MKRTLLLLAAVVFVPLVLSQPAKSIVGVASVVDGDTLEIRGVRIRLWGIDAPESAQLCLNAQNVRYRCGAESANRLSQFIGQRTVTCEQRDTDRYKRMVAVCQVADQSINQWLVENGFALAYIQYGGKVYLSMENAAKAAKRGVWQGKFQAPWDYRKNPVDPATIPDGAPVSSIYYSNCAEARAAGSAPLYRGQPGYREALDVDRDGVACEN